jgi:hypothetical protein
MSETIISGRTYGCTLRTRRRDDRRSLHLQTFLYSLFKRRRKGMRRATDRHTGHYVDLHEPRWLFFCIAVLIMSSMDACFTLLLLQHGVEEVNPLMKLLIDIDATLFINIKIAITAFCVIFITAHKNFWLLKNTLRVRSIMTATLVMYFVLINYQMGMLLLYA